MNIVEVLQRQTHERPDAPAIIDIHKGRDRTITFAELDEETARGASLLLESGLKAGDTVLVLQPMSAELYISLLALFRLGMIAMILDPSAGLDHMERCCAIRRPDGLIATPKAHLLRLVSSSLRRIPRTFSTGSFVPGAIPWSRGQQLPPHAAIIPAPPETPALITFTSGSTGLPKAAVRSHGFLLEQHRVLEKAMALVPGEIDLTTLPVFVFANLASGVASLIPDADLRHPGSIDPAPVLAQIERFRPSRTVASPAFLARLCERCSGTGRRINGFRHVFTGGAPVFPDYLREFAATFAGAEIVAVYGSTEAEPIAHIAWQEMTAEDIRKMEEGGGLLAGAPVPEIRARVIAAEWGTPLGPFSAAEFEKMHLPAGEAGEIVVSGDHVLKGYLHGVGDGETKFRVGEEVWHRTGDCGCFDQKGRLWLLGRASSVIRDARGTLYPFTVECAARKNEALLRAALVARGGKRILFVEPRRGKDISTAELRASLLWAFLDEVRGVERIPMDRRHNAKIDYTALEKML
ncbi:MAG: AMP-binding protein [Geobacter sp.]|nr:AMP-binding protein [Geobacter sp.]